MTKSKLVLLAMLGACGGETESLDAWRGADPHVRLSGEVEGTPIEISDATSALCKREYIISAGTMPELEVTVQVVQDGLEKEFELGFSAANFVGVEPGTRLGIVPPIDGQPPSDGRAYFELEWKWETADGQFVNYEGSAMAGTVAIELLDGTPGPDGVVIPDGTGRLGVFFDSAWPMGGTLAGSLTVSCGANEVE